MRSLRFRGWKAILLSTAIVLVVGAGSGAAVCRFAPVDCGIGGNPAYVEHFVGTGGGEMRLPPGFSLSTVVSDLDFPSDFDFFPDGRIVISEKEGRLRLIKDGELQAEPFLDLRSEVDHYLYRGVINVTVDPDFPDQPYIYVVYSKKGEGASSSTTGRVSRFEVAGDVADHESELVILGKDGESPCASGADCIPAEGDHLGSDIVFAPDGTMFVGTGDGGGVQGGDRRIEQQAFSAQDLDKLSGKILHVDRDGRGLPGNPYWNGNPTSNRSKVWAQGFRNPFRMVSLPDDPETLLLADVGAKRYEELNVVERGSDHGWPCYEGAERHVIYKPHSFCRRYYARSASPDRPWLAARHPSWLSISGGVPIDSATGWPDTFADRYIFGDWVRSVISTVALDVDAPAETPEIFATNAGGPVAFMLRPDGALYYLAANLGELRRIRPD